LKNNLVAAYLLMVGLPVFGLLGILEAGRGIPAPLSITGDWTFKLDPATQCGNGGARQPALNISQSGTEALISLNDGNGHATTLEGTVNGNLLTAKSPVAGISAVIAGKPGARTLEGTIQFDGCAPAAFRAVRQAPKKGGE